jgi:hypothetical protein
VERYEAKGTRCSVASIRPVYVKRGVTHRIVLKADGRSPRIDDEKEVSKEKCANSDRRTRSGCENAADRCTDLVRPQGVTHVARVLPLGAAKRRLTAPTGWSVQGRADLIDD